MALKKYLVDKRWRGMMTRQVVLQAIRSFLTDQGLVEIEVPILSQATVLEPTIGVFETEWRQLSGQKKQRLFLATSPENNFKKLMANGLGDSFAIGHSFRNLEDSGSEHQPEFLMLEWYRQNAQLTTLMEETQALIGFTQRQLDLELKRPASNTLSYQGSDFDLAKPWPVLSLPDLFQKWAKIDLLDALKNKTLLKLAADKGYKTKGANFEQIFNQILLNEIEPHFPLEPFFLLDFPAVTSPMAKAQVKQPLLAARFELYIGGVEVANACVEQDEAKILAKIFAAEKEKLATAGSKIPVDQDFLQAVTINAQQKWAGVGLGVDRLAMILGDSNNIAEVTRADF